MSKTILAQLKALSPDFVLAINGKVLAKADIIHEVESNTSLGASLLTIYEEYNYDWPENWMVTKGGYQVVVISNPPKPKIPSKHGL